MKMLTKKIKRDLPPIGSQAEVADPVVVAKYFNPSGRGTWLVIEGQPHGDTWEFFTFAEIHPGMGELGYTWLSQLESVEGPHGLGIERDIHWKPKPLSKAKAEEFGDRYAT